MTVGFYLCAFIRSPMVHRYGTSQEYTSRERIPTPGKMDSIKDVNLSSLGNSNYVKPLRMHYTQNGIEKMWDLIKIHNSVSIIIYNTTRQVLVFVKQFRPAVYFASIPECDQEMKIDTSKYPPETGITLELCAGIVDKDLPLEEIAKIEVLEECGYDVPVSNFERIISYRSGIGVCGDNQTLFYAEVTDNMKIGKGGGNLEEGEFIEVVEMTVPEAKKYMDKDTVLSPAQQLSQELYHIKACICQEVAVRFFHHSSTYHIS